MSSLFALTAPLALLLPLLGIGGEVSSDAQRLTRDKAEIPAQSVAPQYPASSSDASPLNAFYNGQRIQQIRIEQRVIYRIQPRPRPRRNDLLAQLPQQNLNTKYEERKMDKCVPVGGIAGVQTGSGNRLLLFMRDSKIVSVNLEKACRARDFYSGFYLEKSSDGKLCVDRDKLQSRSGAKCEVERMRQLVAVKD